MARTLKIGPVFTALGACVAVGGVALLALLPLVMPENWTKNRAAREPAGDSTLLEAWSPPSTPEPLK